MSIFMRHNLLNPSFKVKVSSLTIVGSEFDLSYLDRALTKYDQLCPPILQFNSLSILFNQIKGRIPASIFGYVFRYHSEGRMTVDDLSTTFEHYLGESWVSILSAFANARVESYDNQSIRFEVNGDLDLESACLITQSDLIQATGLSGFFEIKGAYPVPGISPLAVSFPTYIPSDKSLTSFEVFESRERLAEFVDYALVPF